MSVKSVRTHVFVLDIIQLSALGGLCRRMLSDRQLLGKVLAAMVGMVKYQEKRILVLSDKECGMLYDALCRVNGVYWPDVEALRPIWDNIRDMIWNHYKQLNC